MATPGSRTVDGIWLQWAIREEFLWDPALAASDVRVSVADGQVTLSGRVESSHRRAALETAAKRVVGVREVNNEIIVAVLEFDTAPYGRSDRPPRSGDGSEQRSRRARRLTVAR